MKRKRDNEATLSENKKRDNEQGGGGDGVQWYRGEIIGKGSFGSVYLAELKKPKSRFGCFPQSMAVKSAEVSLSGSIQKEREALQNIGGCRYIIKCYGDEVTNGDNGEMVYNLLLEYGSGGTLADLIKKNKGSGLPERDVRYYSRSILRGLGHIHDTGYVHCDLKPENILLVSDDCYSGGSKFRVKIGDFGLAKRATKNKKRKLDLYWRGTPTYLSPEAVLDGVQEGPSDIWAFGCVVLEMLTGKPTWGPLDDVDSEVLLDRIGKNGEMPKIPNEVSKEGREFLKGCFSRNPMFRLTSEMLLNHSFLEGLTEDVDEDFDGLDIVDEGAIYTDEFGLSYLVHDTEDECDNSSLSDDDCSFILENVDDEEFYDFDTDGIWSDEETVNQTSQISAFDSVLNIEKEVSTNAMQQNSIIPITIKAGV